MAAATTYNSTRFNSDGTPKWVYSPPSGVMGDRLSATVPTTALDDIGDFYAYFAVPEGKTIRKIEWDVGDHDTHATPTLDMDIVLRVVDKDGTATDTILFNAGTTFQSANQDSLVVSTTVSGSAYGYGYLGFKVNAAAATAAAVASALGADWF